MKKAITLTPAAFMAQSAIGRSVDINQSQVTGSFDLMSSNQVANPLNHHCLPKSLHAILTTQAGAPNADIGSLPQDDVSPASYTMAEEPENDSDKSCFDNDDLIEGRAHDAGASDLARADHAPEKENAAKLTSTSRAKPCRCDASHNTAQS